MATTPSIKVIKSFPFKGGTRLWSNRYHFNGGTPADPTHWHTLMDAVVAAEHLTFFGGITITECVGYAAGSDVPVATKTYSQVGTLTGAAGNAVAPGEVCALVRYATNARTTKNHPIYLFNYVHGCLFHNSGGTQDNLDANMKSTLATYGAAWISGFSDGSITALGDLGIEKFWSETDFSFLPGISCRRVELNELELLALGFGKELLKTFLRLADL